jgi:excisionase family DNA binding protein
MKPAPVAPELLTVLDVAEILRKRPPAVRALARRGELAFVRCGKAMLFRREDLDAYILRCRRPASWERGAAAVRGILG